MPSKTASVPKLEAKVRLFEAASGRTDLLGFADLVIADAFVIKGIRIVSVREEEGGRGRPFLSFPSQKGRGANEGKYFDVAHPITTEARERAAEVVLEAYEEARSGAGARA